MTTKAIFLDRDGVLIEDTHLLCRLEDVRPLAQVSEALARLGELGYKLILVTNQSVVARGLLTLDEALELNRKILNRVCGRDHREVFSAVSLCPYHPQATLEDYRQDVDWRKPKPGALIKEIQKFKLEAHKCYMVGDRPSDLLAGRLAGCQSVLVESRYTNDPMIVNDLAYRPEDLIPDYRFSSLWEFAQSLKGLPSFQA